LAGGLNDVSYDFTQAARSMPNVVKNVILRKLIILKSLIFFFYSDDIKEQDMVGAYCACEGL